jgi:hypothetical protein
MSFNKVEEGVFEVFNITHDTAEIAYNSDKDHSDLVWSCMLCTISGCELQPVPVMPTITLDGLAANKAYLLDFTAKTLQGQEKLKYKLRFCTKPIQIGDIQDLTVLFDYDFIDSGKCSISFTQPKIIDQADLKISYILSLIVDGKILATDKKILSYKTNKAKVSENILLNSVLSTCDLTEGAAVQIGIQVHVETQDGMYYTVPAFPSCSNTYYVRTHGVAVHNFYIKIVNDFKRAVFTNRRPKEDANN